MKPIAILLACAALAGCATVPKSFHPERPLAAARFSTGALDEAFRVHVKDGIVDYPALAGDDRFHRYVASLDRIDPNALPSREERLAFWINAYNVFAIQGILDGYSPSTLIGRYRYFIGRDYRVGGEAINLYDLERSVLIPDFREPRIHFAIVCASRSCPKLRSFAFDPATLSEQLDDSARLFINDPTRNRVDREKKIAYLSMIFKWFEDDFAQSAGSLLRYVARYLSDPESARDLATADYRVEFLPYDWTLNGIDPTKEVSRAGSF